MATVLRTPEPLSKMGNQHAHPKGPKSEQRYIANNMSLKGLNYDSVELLVSSLEQTLQSTPPRSSYSGRELGGLFSGYTGLAYLFLQVSSVHPELDIFGRSPRYWAEKYLKGDRGNLTIERGNCGLACEKIAFDAVKACVTGDTGDLISFLSNVPPLLGPYPPAQGDPFPSELLYGRAGALYMLRMVRHWVPNCHNFVDSPIKRLAEYILDTDDDGKGNWRWHGRRYFGAAHGDIGIITQVVLAAPHLAPKLSDKLRYLLEIQTEEGNWPSSQRSLEQNRKAKLVQWCHGAPGFVLSLQAIRPCYPKLDSQIEDAITRAQELIWSHGLLVKEPSLCHGIFGNAMALPVGEKRNHFLALAMEESVNMVRKYDARLFEPANYDKPWSVLTNYFPSACWAWLVSGEERPAYILYNDV